MSDDFSDDYGAMVAAVDQLSAMTKHLAAPVAAIYHELLGLGVSDAGASVLAGVFMQHMLAPKADD